MDGCINHSISLQKGNTIESGSLTEDYCIILSEGNQTQKTVHCLILFHEISKWQSNSGTQQICGFHDKIKKRLIMNFCGKAVTQDSIH
jgi:hypothetical protein